MLIASAKSWSARRSSHQPAFMDSCLTISHACFPCLPSGRTLYWSDLLVAGNVVSWERWEGSGLGRWERWEGSKLERWKRWEDSEVARSKRLEGNEVASRKGGSAVRWQRWIVVIWQGGRFLVLFKSGGCRVSPGFHLLVLDFIF